LFKGDILIKPNLATWGEHGDSDALLARRNYLAKYLKIDVEQVGGFVIGHSDGRPMLDIFSV